MDAGSYVGLTKVKLRSLPACWPPYWQLHPDGPPVHLGPMKILILYSRSLCLYYICNLKSYWDHESWYIMKTVRLVITLTLYILLTIWVVHKWNFQNNLSYLVVFSEIFCRDLRRNSQKWLWQNLRTFVQIYMKKPNGVNIVVFSQCTQAIFMNWIVQYVPISVDLHWTYKISSTWPLKQ